MKCHSLPITFLATQTICNFSRISNLKLIGTWCLITRRRNWCLQLLRNCLNVSLVLFKLKQGFCSTNFWLLMPKIKMKSLIILEISNQAFRIQEQHCCFIAMPKARINTLQTKWRKIFSTQSTKSKRLLKTKCLSKKNITIGTTGSSGNLLSMKLSRSFLTKISSGGKTGSKKSNGAKDIFKILKEYNFGLPF